MHEILFAQRLADNEKKVRDRALKKLRKYLSIKSSAGAAISQEEALKLWKGLFYCMYMADKPLVQETVAEDISSLIHHINNEEDCKSFVRAGFLTFAREWNGIDVFRINKYMMFVRRFLRHIFTHLKSCDWNLKEVMAYTSILETTVVCPDDNVNKTPLGLKTHVCEIILEELAKIGGENLQNSVLVAVIQPYFKVLALTRIDAYSKFVREGIIRHLIRQSFGTEEVVEQEKEEEADETLLETKDISMEDADSAEKDEEIVALDPRAGKIDTYIPQLKVDFSLLADSLQKVGAVSRVQTKNREVMYRLVCELQDASHGHNPLALPNDHVDDVEVPDTEVEKAVERLEKFEEDLIAGLKPENEDSGDDNLKPVKKQHFISKYQKKKLLRLKKKKQRPKGLPKAKRRKLDKRQQELAKKRAVAVDHMVKRVIAASGVPRRSLQKPSPEVQAVKTHGFEVSPVSQKKKLNIALKAAANNFTIEVASEIKKKRKIIETTNRISKKKCFDVSVIDLQSSRGFKTINLKENGNSDNSTVRENQVRRNVKITGKVQKPAVQIQASACSGEIYPASGQKELAKGTGMIDALENVDQQSGKSVQNVKIKVMPNKTDQQSRQLSSDKATQGSKTEVMQDITPSGKKDIVINTSESNKQKGLGTVVPKKKSPWDEPLKKGEYEIFIKSRKQITKSKKKKVNPIKKRMTATIPKQRTISINLKKNKEHEFSDYVRTLRASPSIPFRADQAPKAPVLKPSPSPILVKGPLLQKRLQKKAAASASLQLNHKKMRQIAADFF